MGLCPLSLLSLTLTAPPVWEQLVATGAGAVVRARDVHALVGAELPSPVQSVHFALVYICQERDGNRQRDAFWEHASEVVVCLKQCQSVPQVIVRIEV